MKTKIVTSRKWEAPDIETFVSEDEVGAKMTLNDFLDALVAEIGDVTKIKNSEQLKSKINVAAADVLHEMRKQTVYVV